MRVGLIGAGIVGHEVYQRAERKGWHIAFVERSDGVYRTLDKHSERISDAVRSEPIDLAFLQIPTFDDGSTAYRYIRTFVDRGIPIVTAEKGASAHYARELAPFSHLLGNTASVGGGTRMLRHVEGYPRESLHELHAIVNGTTNYSMDGLAKKKSIAEVIQNASALGYTEPGAHDPLNVFNQEVASDIPMKTSILWNTARLTEEIITPHMLRGQKLSSEELEQLISEAAEHRYIVSFTPFPLEEETLGGFTYVSGSWHIQGGFRKLRNSLERTHLCVPGVSNTLVILNRDRQFYSVTGPGAGAVPTVETMMSDAKEILEHRR